MTSAEIGDDLDVSRRRLLAAAGFVGGMAAAMAVAKPQDARAAAAPSGPMAPPVAGLHLQFGADASSEMVVSWHTLQPVERPRVYVVRCFETVGVRI